MQGNVDRETLLNDSLCDNKDLFIAETETEGRDFRDGPSMGGHNKNLQ